MGVMTQARDRSRRIGQLLPVENFELSVLDSFQDRVFYSTITKYLPNAMAELSINVEEIQDVLSGDDTKRINIGHWYLVDGELVQAPDPRVDNLPRNKELSPEEFLNTLISTARGRAINTKDWHEEKLDQAFALNDVQIPLV